MQEVLEQRALEIRKFNRFYTNIIGLVNKTILESPYSLAEVRVLLEIDRAGQCTAADLVRLLRIDAGYLSRMLARFVKTGLVSRTPSSADGRVQVLTLTDKGRETFRQLSDASTRQIVEILGNLSGSEQEKLVGHMAAIMHILAPQRDKLITIRTQKSGDAGYIAYRHGVLYEQEYGLDRVFEQYVVKSLAEFLADRPLGDIWVAECDGQIAGFIGIVGVDAQTAQLRWFLVEPEFRGLGLGRRLITTALDFCRQNGLRHVFLWTFQELSAARHLYRSFGFTPTEHVPNDTWKKGLVEERWDTTLPE